MNKQTWAFKAQANLPRLLGRAMRHAVLGVVMLAGTVPLLARAQNSIQAVSGSVQGGSEVIRVDMAEALTAVPTGFSIQSPARIALDFQGVTTPLGRSAMELNLGNLRSANLVQAGERTRLVLNLKTPTAYRAEIQGKSLLIILDAQTAAAPSVMVSPTFAESRNRDTLPLKDIDFRRGTDSSGRIVVALPNNEVGVDIRQQGKTLVVEFMKTALPEGLRRRLDVADFGTPVQTVTTFQAGDKVRMVVEPAGEWEHSAYQSDNQFVLEVRRQKTDASKLSQGTGYSGEKLSLNFQNIEIRSLLQVIADFTNFNVVTSDTVTGSVTLRLKDVPWDQALDIILQAKGLDRRKTGNVLLIAPKDELAAQDKQNLESRNTLQGLESVRTQDFKLNYAKAEEIAKGLLGTGEAGATKILSPRGSVISETRTNQLFVTDIPSKLEQVEGLIIKLDIPVRQVLIEARIVEASDTFGKSLGVRLGGRPFTLNGQRNAQLGDSYISPSVSPPLTTGSPQASQISGYYGATGNDFVNLPASGINGYSAATFALSLFSAPLSRLLNLEISAMEADGKGKIVSSPRILTADKKEASIEQGVEIPFQKATSSGATAIDFIKANLSLKVTPQITPEGSIIMDVEVTKNSLGQATAVGVSVNTKRVNTQVLVENGGTVVIGGIFEQNEQNDETKVPLLGDLPWVGNFFKTSTRSSNRSELLIFLSPRVVAGEVASR